MDGKGCKLEKLKNFMVMRLHLSCFNRLAINV